MFLRDCLRDLRYSWRQFVATPLVTCVAVLTLAVGIGALRVPGRRGRGELVLEAEQEHGEVVGAAILEVVLGLVVVPDGLHEKTFSEVNTVVRRLEPAPEFIIFPGDEIIGLTPDRDQLLAQWRHWIDSEMGWLDRRTIPMWHATGNHTTYDEMSEQVFRDVLGLPRNGPAGQEGLSYWVRRGDLLLVFVNTLWSGLGGEGFVETQWLEDVLRSNSDACHKLVIGHHPVYSVNGYSGPSQRDVEPGAVACAAYRSSSGLERRNASAKEK